VKIIFEFLILFFTVFTCLIDLILPTDQKVFFGIFSEHLEIKFIFDSTPHLLKSAKIMQKCKILNFGMILHEYI
jgi:hypothetical protein